MIRKWSYVAAAMMTLASGMALTSCIDNDEPYGIEQIRLATANLLDAKKAAVEAEAAAKSAQVEIAKINAEIEKLRIENEKIQAQANADYRAAEARYLDALAEAEKLRAEGDKAVSDAEAARLNAEAQKAQAEADKWLAEAEKIRKEAEANYQEKMQQVAEAQQKAEDAHNYAVQKLEEAKYWFEKQKATIANAENNALWVQVEGAFGDYLDALDKFNTANKQYLHALNMMAEIEADLVWVPGNNKDPQDPGYIAGHFESPAYGMKKALQDLIAAKQRDIETYQEKIDIYEEFLAKVDAFKDGDWAKLLDEYKQKLADAEVAYAQARLEQEAVKLDQPEVYDAPKQLEEEYNAMGKEPIAIDPYTIEPIAVLGAVNSNWQSPKVVVAPNTTYSLEDDANYIDAQTAYKKWIKKFTLAMLDDNDIAWSQARLNEMNRQLENDKALQDAVAVWKIAKEAYAMGNKPLGSVLPLGDELQEAIDNYNDFGATVIAAKDKVTEARDEENTAKAAYEEAMNTYQSSTDKESVPGKLYQALVAKEKAESAARLTLMQAQDKAELTCKNEIEACNLKRSKLYVAYQKALQAQAALPDTATDEEIENAKKAVKKAYQDYYSYAYGYVFDSAGNIVYDEWGYQEFEQSGYDKEVNAAYEARTEANKEAYAAYNVAITKAQDDYNTAWDAYLKAGGSNLAEKDPKYKPVADALAEYQKARENTTLAQNELNKISTGQLRTLWNEMNKLSNNQRTEIAKLLNESTFTWDYNGAIPQYYSDVNDFVNGSKDEFPTAVAPIELLNGEADVPNGTWESQVYANARSFVELTSGKAFGILGTDFDKMNPSYDWEQDKAFLLDEVNVDVINEYIEKVLLKKSGKDKEDITPFDYEQFYDDFGLYGQQASLLVKISYAEACVNPDANSSITAEIDVLKANLEALEKTNEEKNEAWAEKKAEWDAADEAALALDAAALAAVTKAKEIRDTYKRIVNNLGIYVNTILAGEVFEDDFTSELTTIEAVKKKLKEEADGVKSDLAVAQERLEYYQYQLTQLESDEYAKVQNPWAIEVKDLEAKVAAAQEKVDFYKARYDELQAKYDAANKQ